MLVFVFGSRLNQQIFDHSLMDAHDFFFFLITFYKR
jgi:hypothetical protein